MRRSVRRIGNILLWSGVSNLVLAGVFFIGWNFENIRKAIHKQSSSTALAALPQKEPEPASVSRLQRQEDQHFTSGLQRHLKESLQMMVIPSSSIVSAVYGEDAPGEKSVTELDLDEEGYEAEGPAMNPVLLKNSRTGQLEIGNFQTVSLTGGTDQCLALADTMLGDAGAPSNSLQVLSDSKLITIARICTANGAIILTCRGGQITISPRRLKPNERCES